MLVTFEVRGKELIERFETGIEATYDVTQNNKYGLVASSSISAIEPNETEPTIAASAVVINRAKKEVWLSFITSGRQSFVNDLSHGPCIFKP